MNTKALYTGSFDPMTNGHLDIIKRAARLCDELTVGIIGNPQKKAMFTLEERATMMREALEGIENAKVEHFSGLTADYVNENGFNVIVRGLRSTLDFEYEAPMERMNARLFDHDVETIYLMADPAYSFVSSTIVKEVFNLGGSIEGLVPDVILKYMKRI